MGIAKVEEALSAFELLQWETPTTRREEDQPPLVQYSSRSRILNGPDPDVSSPPEDVYDRKMIIFWSIFLILALVIGLSVGLTWQSVSSWHLPLLDEILLNTLIDQDTKAT